MSYIRMGSRYQYAGGKSKDYVWPNGEKIIDYGSISDETLVELLHRNWKTEDSDFKDYLIFRLAKRLNVKLRSGPKKKGASAINHTENKIGELALRKPLIGI
jgi:hypothetical protein